MSGASSRSAVLAAMLALALGAAACGGSDDDNGGGDSNAEVGQVESAGNGDNRADVEEVEALMSHLRDTYNSADGAAFCAALTKAGQKEIADSGRRIPAIKGRGCAAFITELGEIIGQASHRPVRVRRVKIDGDDGTVTMQGGLAGIRSIATYKVAKVDGAWKVVDPISGNKTRRLPQRR